MSLIGEISPTIPRNASLEGVIIPRIELGVSFGESSGVDYLDSPMQVFRSVTEDGDDRFDLEIDHPPLSSLQFLGFLGHAAPRTGDGVIGVHEDWKEILEATSGRWAYLMEIHGALGRAWEDFMPSLPDYVEVLGQARKPTFNGYNTAEFVNVSDKERSVEGISIRLLAGVNANQLAQEPTDEIEAKVQNFLLHAIARQIGKETGKRQASTPQTTPEHIRRFSSWGNEKRYKVVRSALRATGPASRFKLMSEAIEQLLDKAEFAGTEYLYPKSKMADGLTLHDAFLTAREVRDGSWKANVIDIRRSDDKVESVVVRQTIKKERDLVEITPRIAWTRNGAGERGLILERDRTEVADGTVIGDGVLGAIALAYFQPQIRGRSEIWPKTMGAPGARNEQRIGAAQVPVLALMRRAQLLKTDFIEAVESVS